MIINELSEKVFSELESLFLIPLGMKFQKYTFGFGTYVYKLQRRKLGLKFEFRKVKWFGINLHN